jgi:hypothetical protein
MNFDGRLTVMKLRQLALFALFLLPLFAQAAVFSCPGLISKKSIPKEDLAVVWFSAVEFGNHEKTIARDRKTGVRQIVMIESEHSFERYHPLENVTLHRSAPDDAGAYYARFTTDLATGKTSVELFSLESEALINRNIGRHMQMVWKVYVKEGTVEESEVAEFDRLEAHLAPQRKISTAVVNKKTGETLAFMRTYDGSVFPTYFFGALGTEFEFRATDNRLPIETRYPNHDFRKGSEYAFEAGRLAKNGDLDSVLEHQFFSLGQYLHEKHGYLKTAPRAFWQGRVNIEITGRNLDKFLRPRNEGGYGFHLEYKPPVKKAKKEKKSQSQKYILYQTVQEFINNFYMKVQERDPRRYYKDLINSPPPPAPANLVIPTGNGRKIHVFGGHR